MLFGAFDRHNFGDLLFPHIAIKLLSPEKPVFAGLAASDLRPFGGHDVQAIAGLAASWQDAPVHIVHVGGEILTCDAWEAGVMTLPPAEAGEIMTRFVMHSAEAREWARKRVGMAGYAPYSVMRSMFPCATSVIYNAVGGVELDRRDNDFRGEVFDKLREADAVGVRDHLTEAHLRAAGIACSLMPDSAVMVAELFGDLIRGRADGGEVAQARTAFPQGYLAVQFSVDFSDAAAVSTIGSQLDAVAGATGLGVVFFRAGAAPWHDEIGCLERAARQMKRAARVFASLDVWDICALIAASRGYAGSSLHGRIVATAFGLPRVSLVHDVRGSKVAAYVATWEEQAEVAEPNGLARALAAALAVDVRLLRKMALQLAESYRLATRQLFGV
ncbi:hypothetical protein AYR66_03765 [Noviherbaspirillum denitrificans]|uniref:Polysaccharide pyruvyl transferase domain-containing protein n=1 Tax=Noviherbaspirillum denitrificans TaxID=1968433 RepID=A0A254TC33_9BURK|nr:hypothetical protein AYR66_03765 [Noviherbaspirillum denitrificans]